MILVVTAAGFGLLTLPAAMRRVGRRLVPRQWAVLCAVALFGGVALVIASLLVIAAPRALDAVGLPAAARACEHMLGGLYPGGFVVWTAATVLELSMVMLGAKAVIHARRSVRRASIASAAGVRLRHRAPLDVVVMPDDRSCALSVPQGRRGGRVMISQGMVDTLSSSELDAVCAHEAAHLRFSHQRYLVLAVLVE
jgi:Zn-dependent protease with chaperone function